MLIHHSMGPTSSGDFLVTYDTPGCRVPTVACVCATAGQADEAAKRLNDDQRQRDRAVRADRLARGLRCTEVH